MHIDESDYSEGINLLVVLSEECAEVIKDTAKAIRFSPDDSCPSCDMTNAENIAKEFQEAIAIYEELERAGVIPALSETEKQSIRERKKQRVKDYYQESLETRERT